MESFPEGRAILALPKSEWLDARNLSAAWKGSIHDDDVARELGFREALIGGSVQGAFLTKVLVEVFGSSWYVSGFLKQSYLNPLYEAEQFRVVVANLEPTVSDGALVELGIEAHDGRRITTGFAGLGNDAAKVVLPWEREPSSGEIRQAAGPARQRQSVARTVARDDSRTRLEMAADHSAWYRTTSPWGGPIVPSFMYMLLGGSAARTLPPAAMNGTWQLRQFGPMFADSPYIVTSELVASGSGKRTSFETVEFSVADERSRIVAIARQTIKWFSS